MARGLAGMRIAILATDGVERVELEQPRGALYGAGAGTDLLSIHPGEIQARQFDGGQETVKVARVPDEDFPVVTPDSPLGSALLGTTVGDEISWSAPEGRLRARVTDIQVSVGGRGEGAGHE